MTPSARFAYFISNSLSRFVFKLCGRMNLPLVLLIVGFVAEPAHAIGESAVSKGSRPALDDDASLEDYLAYAALSNPGLEAAFNRWMGVLERVAQVSTLPDPRFSYGYFIREVETRVGPQQHRIGLSQAFPWFGKLKLRGDVATEEARVIWERYQAAKLQLFDEVNQAYFELYYIGRAIVVTSENIELLSYLEEVVRSRYESGAALHGDVIKAQVELDKLRDRLSTLRDVKRPATARLNATLNRSPYAPVPLPVNFRPGTLNVDPVELGERMREGNPDLRGLDAAALREESAIKLARKDYYPSFTAGVDYIVTGEARMPGVADSGKDPVMFGVSISLPIWRDKYRSGVDEAERRLRAIKLDRREAENRLDAALEMAIFRLNDAERKVALYRDALIPKADQNLRVIQRAFEAGKTEFLSLIDAERVLLEFQLTLERASADREQSISIINRLTGIDFPDLAGPYEDEMP